MSCCQDTHACARIPLDLLATSDGLKLDIKLSCQFLESLIITTICLNLILWFLTASAEVQAPYAVNPAVIPTIIPTMIICVCSVVIVIVSALGGYILMQK